MAGYVIGVDVGGTFIDSILLDPASATFRVAKTPSSPNDPSSSFMASIDELDVTRDAIDAIVHGTTVATNAILERKGAKCGLITTNGFRDILELGRRTRPQTYGLRGNFEALIPREMRLEVSERISADGEIITPLDEEEVRAALSRLETLGAESVLIHYLNSYANPVHEHRSLEISLEIWKNAYVTTSAQILNEFREFERGSAGAINAYVQPIVARYLTTLGEELSKCGFIHDLLIMQGNGGMMASPVASREAAHTVMSGPAAGVIAAAAIGKAAGFPNLISCDMGGTSFDVALIREGQPAISHEKDIAYSIPLRVPMIDIHTIGSGGGSIARINAAGILQVGPESAGAQPGPICYGRGGQRPTVTDANLLLGRINLESIPGIASPADIKAVEAAFEDELGRPLGMDAVESAAAVIAVSANQLAGAIRLVSIERGHDPRDFALFAFGGGGPLVATQLARELGIPKLLVPRYPGITSALGCIVADVRHDYIQTVNQPLEEIAGHEVDDILDRMAERGCALIEREGIAVSSVDVTHEADMLYEGQSHTLRIPVTSPGFDPIETISTFAEIFRGRYEFDLPEMRPILMNLRTFVRGLRTSFDMRMLGGSMETAAEVPGEDRRRVMFGEEWFDTWVLRREALKAGMQFEGPAIIEQLDTTVAIDPGSSVEVDEFGNLLITV